jgi:hypothetical protein
MKAVEKASEEALPEQLSEFNHNIRRIILLRQ